MARMTRRRFGMTAGAAMLARPAWAQPAPLQFHSAGQGSAFLPYAEAVAAFVAAAGGQPLAVRTSSGSLENLRAIEASRDAVGTVFLGSAHDAVTGAGPFAGARLVNLRALFAMYETSFQIAAPRASGIRSLADLAGRTVGVGPAGGPAEVFFRGAAEIAGVSSTIVNGAPAEQGRQLLGGQIDAFWQGAVVPIPALKAVTDQADMAIIGLSPAQATAMLARFPALALATVPAGSYRGQSEPVVSVAAWNFVLAHKDLPDAAAEALTRAVFAASAPERQIHAMAAGTTARNADKNRIVPFHPGSVAAHRAFGVTPPAI